MRWDHPRLRGEHSRFKKTLDISSGSPPHTRGTLKISAVSPLKDRITPAYAGNTNCIKFTVFAIRDHPRIRGEHKGLPQTLHRHPGSPPLTRGTPVPLFRTILLSGITPAYAGNTYANGSIPRIRGDHPRLRGEHFPVISIDGLS